MVKRAEPDPFLYAYDAVFASGRRLQEPFSPELTAALDAEALLIPDEPLHPSAEKTLANARKHLRVRIREHLVGSHPRTEKQAFAVMRSMAQEMRKASVFLEVVAGALKSHGEMHLAKQAYLAHKELGRSADGVLDG